jgi:DNA (cytosine-5)-methyltransferase 1
MHTVLKVGLARIQAARADPKASLLDQYVRLLNGTRPKAFLMENVYGLAYRNQNRPVFTRFKKSVKRAGYSLESRILLVADYGVPQLRQRLFCVGIRGSGPGALITRNPAPGRT